MALYVLTLEAVDLLAIAGIALVSLLAVGGGALAWLRSDNAKSNDSLRATGARVEVLVQAFLAGAPARDSMANSPGPGSVDPAELRRSSEGIE